MSLDLDLVVALTRSKDVKKILEYGIEPELLFDSGQMALEEALQFYRQYGTVPELATLIDIKPELSDSLAPYFAEDLALEPLDYYLDQVKTRKALNILAKSVHDSGSLLDSREPKKVIEVMTSAVIEAQSYAERKKVITTATDFADKLWEDYEFAEKAQNGILGYTTPWPSLDQRTAGLVNQDLVLIAARLGVGKTWLLCKLIAHLLLRQPEPVSILVVSMEMSKRAILQRILACMYMLPSMALRMGRLGDLLKARYKEILDGLRALPLTIVGEGGVNNPDELEMLVQQVKPQVLAIDGLYLMDSAISMDDEKMVDKITKVVTRVQRMTLSRNIVTLATTQLNRKATGKEKGKAEYLGYADALGQAASHLWFLWRDEDLKRLKRMEIIQAKNREGPGELEQLLNWDHDTMNFLEYSQQGVSGAEVPTENGVTVTNGSQGDLNFGTINY